MRVYVPATSRDLVGDLVSARRAHAVTAQLRSALPDEDEEGWETSASLCAADASVLLLAQAQEREAADRRVVIAADVPDASVEVVPLGEDVVPGTVEVTVPVAWSAVAAILVDEAEAEAHVRAARAGDEEAFERAAEADLLWFDVSERLLVARSLGGGSGCGDLEG